MKQNNFLISSKSAKPEGLSADVKRSIINQFAENQNHHQRLFIQFLTSMLFVLAAYAFVYTNTRYPNESAGYRLNTIDTIQQVKKDSSRIDGIWSDTVAVKKFNTIKSVSGNILSYGIIHLVSIYLFTQFVLTILLIMILHLGYSFRRDQMIVNKIRTEALGDSGYNKLFNDNFRGTGKNIFNYLPNFYSILFSAIFATQIFVYFSIYIYLNISPKNDIFIHDFFNNNISYGRLKYFLIFPSIVCFTFYIYYFMKYNNKVNNAPYLKNLSIIKVSSRKVLTRVTIISFTLALIKFILYSQTKSIPLLIAGLIESTNGFASWISMYLLIKSPSTDNVPGQTRDYKSKLIFRNSLHGFMFLLCFISSTLFTFWAKTPTYFSYSNLIYVLAIMLTLFYVIYRIQNKIALLGTQPSVFVKLLENEVYILLCLVVCYVLVASTGIKMFEMVFSIIFLAVILLWSFSRFSSALNIYFSRKKDL